MITTLLWMTLAGISSGAEAGRSWSGDAPRAAVAALPRPQTADFDHGPFLVGAFSSAGEWNRYVQVFAGSSWGEPWRPDVDWSRQRVVYAAFGGATRMLALEEWRVAGEGVGELVFGVTFTRRRESPDGPCSMVLRIVDVAGLETVRIKYLLPGGDEEVLAGELLMDTAEREGR